MKLTIQIVNFRSRHYLERCLFSISENLPAEIEAEVLLVNNDENPLDEFSNKLKGKCSLRILEIRKNIGFGKAHNAGFKSSRGKYILFLNPDTQILPGALQAMLDVFEKDHSVGLAGPLLVGAAGKIQPDCFGTRKTPLSPLKRKIFGFDEQRSGARTFETDWISGGAMFARRDVFDKLGGFDERFFMYFEDVDLCYRAKQLGHKIAVNSDARIFHESGKSFESEREKKRHYYASQNYYFRKHFGPVSAAIVKLVRLPYYVKNVYLKR